MTISEKGIVVNGTAKDLAKFMVSLQELQEEKNSRDLASSIFGQMPFGWFSVQNDEEK